MTGTGMEADAIRDELRALLAIRSPTGMCGGAAAHVAERLESMGLSVVRGRDGSIRCVIPGRDPASEAVGFVAHLDTLGAQVKALKDNGRLELVSVGTWSARFAEGARVMLHTDTATLTGTILPLKASGHTYNEEVDTQPCGWQHVELRVDARADSAADLLALGINTGDMVSIDPQPEFLDGGYIVSRHLDDKAGAAVMLVAAQAIATDPNPPRRDVHLMFTVTEEIGTGAASIVDPRIADLIAIDIGTTAPGQASREHGVTVAMGDQSGPFDRDLTLQLIAFCKAADIDFQRDVFRYYRSDLASARQSGVDARMALLAFGVDASHGYERIHDSALTGLCRLIAGFALSD